MICDWMLWGGMDIEMVDGREMCVHIEFAVLCKEFERIW